MENVGRGEPRGVQEGQEVDRASAGYWRPVASYLWVGKVLVAKRVGKKELLCK